MSASDETGLGCSPYPTNSGSYSPFRAGANLESSSVGIGGSGDAGDSRMIVCVVVVDLSVGVGSSTTSCFSF